jgi:hypothetical protein
MQVVITVALAVDVPEGTDLDCLYLDLPAEQVEVLSLNDDQPVPATVEGYETLNVGVPGAEEECGEAGEREP